MEGVSLPPFLHLPWSTLPVDLLLSPQPHKQVPLSQQIQLPLVTFVLLTGPTNEMTTECPPPKDLFPSVT